MSFLTGLLGAAAQVGTAALQAPPSTATRASADFNPVVNINAVGAVDLKQIGDLIHGINADFAYTGGLAGNLQATSPLQSPFSKGTPMNLLLVAGVGVAVIFLWWKFAK